MASVFLAGSAAQVSGVGDDAAVALRRATPDHHGRASPGDGGGGGGDGGGAGGSRRRGEGNTQEPRGEIWMDGGSTYWLEKNTRMSAQSGPDALLKMSGASKWDVKRDGKFLSEFNFWFSCKLLLSLSNPCLRGRIDSSWISLFNTNCNILCRVHSPCIHLPGLQP